MRSCTQLPILSKNGPFFANLLAACAQLPILSTDEGPFALWKAYGKVAGYRPQMQAYSWASLEKMRGETSSK